MERPKRGSILIGLIQKTLKEIKKAIITTVISLNKINQEPIRSI
jgi:hypothetical protein